MSEVREVAQRLQDHIGSRPSGRTVGHADLELVSLYGEQARAGVLMLGRTRAGVTQVIASGVIDFVSSYVLVDTESAAASDDLDTLRITGPVEAGSIAVLQAADDARTVVVKHGTGNFYLNGSTDFSLDNLSDTIGLVYSPAKAGWCEMWRSANG